MNCPQCKETAMEVRPTSTGVALDNCTKCDSIWFDRGEVFFFIDDKRGLNGLLKDARASGQGTEFASPESGETLVQVSLPDSNMACLDKSSGAVWFPGDSVKRMRSSKALRVDWNEGDARAAIKFNTPSLIARTLFTLTGLYGLLTVVLIGISLAGGMEAWVALAIAVGFALVQYLISPFIMDFFQRVAYKTRWVSLAALPKHLQEFVKSTCAEHKMKLPRFGIIPDLSPNAFTYGHTPNNARVVITQGLVELLEEKELESVVAHEIGHARNWDMVLMTLANLVPMVLYFIYRVLIRIRVRDGRARAAAALIALGASILYIITTYVVLWFSRTREYHADKFGAKAVKSGAAMGRALVKVAYGLAGRSGKEDEEEGAQSGRKASAIGAMGIFDSSAAQALAVTSGGRGSSEPTSRIGEMRKPSGGVALAEPPGSGPDDEPPKKDDSKYSIDSDSLKGAMKWDLWNPWAMWYELHSTHPLVAKRLLHLSALSVEMGEEPLVRFDLPKPESFWDEFFVDVFVKMLPTFAFIGGIAAFFATQNEQLIGPGILVLGMAMLIKLRFRYPTGNYPEMSVATLLRQVKVSDIRPIPCTLEGTIRGKGVPGLIWSDDFVMQDDTGILFLDHRQPFSLWETIWGWMRGDKLIGGHVVVEGWYRRAPMPFLEINRFTVDGVERKSWLWRFRYAGAWIVTIAGVVVTGLVMAGILQF